MARPAPILALVTGAVEWRLAKDWTLTAKLDGEFGQGSRTYSATTRLSYAWRGSPPCFSRIVLQSSDRKPRLPANRHAARPTHIGQRRFRLNDAAVNGHSGSHRGDGLAPMNIAAATSAMPTITETPNCRRAIVWTSSPK
jgi:hypothetical protein